LWGFAHHFLTVDFYAWGHVQTYSPYPITADQCAAKRLECHGPGTFNSHVAWHHHRLQVQGTTGTCQGAANRGDSPVVTNAMSPSLNTQQASEYQRLDLRVNKVIYGPKYKLTLKAEIANVLNHDNWRYYDYTYPTPDTAQTVAISRNTTMPRLPTLGLSLEF
jgi:outer membrane cobalamin receptor